MFLTGPTSPSKYNRPWTSLAENFQAIRRKGPVFECPTCLTASRRNWMVGILTAEGGSVLSLYVLMGGTYWLRILAGLEENQRGSYPKIAL